jgi:hypothetical protein
VGGQNSSVGAASGRARSRPDELEASKRESGDIMSAPCVSFDLGAKLAEQAPQEGIERNDERSRQRLGESNRLDIEHQHAAVAARLEIMFVALGDDGDRAARNDIASPFDRDSHRTL